MSETISHHEVIVIGAAVGTTVIRAESEAKPDPVRGAVPFMGEQDGFENSLLWHLFKAGKLSVTGRWSSRRGGQALP
ncbi:MAG: hypothetical protein OXB99_12155 [Acidimicrobiaceae bacterium]|nr:hypothetical protein [Acidimicrobiaceae bacterium]